MERPKAAKGGNGLVAICRRWSWCCCRQLLIFATSSIFVLGQGCEDKKSEFKPLSGGFGVMAQWVGIDSGPRAELYYKTNNSKPVLIWPFLDGEMYYTNDLFFFEGFLRDEEGKITIQRYFAAQAPGPAIDISDDLLKRFTESNGLDLGIARKKYSPWKAEKVADGIKVFLLLTSRIVVVKTGVFVPAS
jgi:hypothetical protein